LIVLNRSVVFGDDETVKNGFIELLPLITGLKPGVNESEALSES
jgi:hypothetical protein